MTLIQFRVKGADRFIVKMQRIRANLPLASNEAMFKYAQKVKRVMKEVIASSSKFGSSGGGHLRDHIEVEPSTVSKSAKGYNIISTLVKDGYPIGEIVDKGTSRWYVQKNSIIPKFRRKPGHPPIKPMFFAARALGRTREEFRAEATRSIKKLIERS